MASPRLDVTPPLHEPPPELRIQRYRVPDVASGDDSRPAPPPVIDSDWGTAPPLPHYAPGELPPGWGVPAPEPRNDIGVAALVLGLAAVLAGLVPQAFAIAYVISVVTVPAGFLALLRVRAGIASNRGVALTAALLGIAGLALSGIGYVLTR